MKQLAIGTAKRIVKALLYGIVGGALVLLVLAVKHLNDRPDLLPWHTADLDEEFTRKSSVTTFEEYLALEDRLFKQLDELVYDKTTSEPRNLIARYQRDSISDPARWPQNWNRSYELPHDSPKAAVLLIHGLTDSPYSLRHLGETLHQNGAHVLSLRVPGHGTAPSALATVTWDDMAAAVPLATRHLKKIAPNQPLFIVGYSNGAALGIHYILDSLEDPALPKVDALTILSPEIAITRLAGLAIWQERLGHLLGLEKLAWSDLLPEYDPFKYNSFPFNAANQVHRITNHNTATLIRLSKAGQLKDFPPTLAFQSVVDATVTAPALVKVFFDHLPRSGHELVAFGLDRSAEIEPLLKVDPQNEMHPLVDRTDRTFILSVIQNRDENTRQVVLRSLAMDNKETVTDLNLAWPGDIYSLAHVALPFPEEDPLYGGPDHGKSPGISLGDLALRGEKGVLIVSAANLLRLRWNPFYSYLEERTLEHFQLAP